MEGMKSQTLHLSATRIIEDIPDKNYVGVVMFYENAEICHSVIQITDRSVKDKLIRSIPTDLKGGTDIGKGILLGVQALRDQGICTEGATIFLVTDGEDITNTDYVSTVLPILKSAKIKVVAIAIGNSADRNLERLTKETNGYTHFVNENSREMMARVIESAVREVRTSKELAEAVNISVCDDIIQLNQTLVTKNVTIDPDIGRNTVFTIGSEDINSITVSIQSPKGHKYDLTSNEVIKNENLKRIQLKPKVTESGDWFISLTKHSNQRICANISVKSQPIVPNVIQMRVTLKDADSSDPPIIITEIRKGNDAVVGAEVTATVDKPDGTQSQLKLINFGHIYCNYFTDYCGFGRYNVTVLAQNMGSVCYLKSLGSGPIDNSIVPRFERQLIVGCFKVTDCMPSRPSDDLKLQKLSDSHTFNSLPFNLSVPNIQTPAPRTAKAIIKPKVRSIPQTDDLIKAKENINHLLLIIKKSINSPKITENERNSIRKMMDQIDCQINTKTINELNNYLKHLEEFHQKIF